MVKKWKIELKTHKKQHLFKQDIPERFTNITDCFSKTKVKLPKGNNWTDVY